MARPSSAGTCSFHGMRTRNPKMEQFRKRFIIWAPIFWLALIWMVSSIPAKKLPSAKVVSIDKVAHIAQYLILSLLANRAFRLLKVKPSLIPWIYLLLLLSAGLDEWHQHLIPQRSVSVWDFVANGIGLGIGFTLFWISRDRSSKPLS